MQPLPAEIAECCTATLPAVLPASPSGRGRGTSTSLLHMLRIDLDAVGIPYVIEGPDGPLYADFHVLRHSYVALLDRAGLTLKQAMQLARHSDPEATMAVYGCVSARPGRRRGSAAGFAALDRRGHSCGHRDRRRGRAGLHRVCTNQ